MTASSFTVYTAPTTSPVIQDNSSIVTSIDAPADAKQGEVYSLTVNYYSDALVGTTVQCLCSCSQPPTWNFNYRGNPAWTPGSILLLESTRQARGVRLRRLPAVLKEASTRSPAAAADPSITVNFIVTSRKQ